MTFRTVAIAVFFWISGAVLRAEAPPVIVDGKPFFISLGSHLSTFVDPTGHLEVWQLQMPERLAQFQPARSDVPSFGFTKAAVWMRFTVESRADHDETLIVELGMSRLSHVTWFVVDGDAVEQSLRCGVMDIRGAHQPAFRFPTIEFVVPAGKTRTVFMRAQSDTAVWLPLNMGTPLQFDDHSSRRDFWDFAHIGFCAALALLSLGLWAAGSRNRLYLSIALAMTAAVAYFAMFSGIYAWLGGPWPQWMSRQGVLVLALLFSYMFIRFSQDFLGWKMFSQVEKAVFIVGYALTGTGMMACLFLPYSVSVQFMQPAQLLGFALAGGVSVLHWRRRGGKGLGLFVLAWAILLAGVVFLFLQINTILPITGISPYDTVRFIFPGVFLVFMLAGARAQREVLQMQSKVARLERAETVARLEALRYQLNPHFLFNTLTSIEELSHEAPSRIPRLVGRLADFLRLRLDPEPESSIRLARELESVRAYLDIEQVRFEDRLKVVYDIDADAQDCLVPELVLMPLVENAIKYGFRDSETLDIRIAARIDKHKLMLRVENNGSLQLERKGARGAGVGTRNLRARLSLKYGAVADFRLGQHDNLVVAEVQIPAVKV